MLKPPPLWLVSRESLIHTELFLSARDSVHRVRDAFAPLAVQYTRKLGLHKRGMHPAVTVILNLVFYRSIRLSM